VTFALDPLPQTKLILGSAEQLGLLLSVLMTL
jgi:hypothetical protein